MPDHVAVIAEMEQIEKRLIVENDERQHFHGAYLRSTNAVLAEAAADGFIDSVWAERWGLAFAQLYLDAFNAWDRGDDAPGPWQVAFDASTDHDIPPVRHSLLGINAHINYDLPQAFLAVITDDEFGDEKLMERRSVDHHRVDAILVERVPEEDKRLAEVEDPGDRNLVDALMQPFNRWGTRRFLKEGRDKVWQNARLLSDARAQSSGALAQELAVLDDLCRQRVADLVSPRYVIMHLATHGFGVALPPRSASNAG
jgi:hypothetical protein